MLTFTLSVSLGEILCAIAAVALAIVLYRRCRILHRAVGLPLGHNRVGVLYERDDLAAKLAVAVSLIVSRAELDSVREDDQGTRLLNALRETCLAIVESTWLRDLERAYEDSKNRRIAAYEQSTSISELRGKIEHENRRLRREIEAVSHRLEQMLDASHGRSAKASDKLSQILDRILR